MEVCRWLREGTVRSEEVKHGAMKSKRSKLIDICTEDDAIILGNSGSMILKKKFLWTVTES